MLLLLISSGLVQASLHDYYDKPHDVLDPVFNGTCWPMAYIRPHNAFPNTCKNGTQKSGPLCFPECKPGYHARGLFCARNKDADSKLPRFYGRGFGSFLSCPSNNTGFAGICHKECGEGYVRSGPICWAKCGGDYPYKCGLGCASSRKNCKRTTFDQLQSSSQFAANLIGLVALMQGTPLTGVVLGTTVVDAAVTESLKNYLQVEMKDFTGVPESIITGIFSGIK